MSDSFFAVLAAIALGSIAFLFYWVVSNPPVCDGAKTGIEHYHGDVVECYRGDVIRVIHRGSR